MDLIKSITQEYEKTDIPEFSVGDTVRVSIKVKEGNKETSDSEQTQKTDTPKVPRQPQELVTQGISFLSGLAQTLQSPEATQQLVDTLVETNEETGESHLRIPVPDKQTVQTLLNFVGKLFNNI